MTERTLAEISSMTSNNSYYEFPHKIPTLDPELEAECEDGVYKINLPTLKDSELVIDDQKVCKTIQLRCNSCFLKHPDTICKCNSTIKTIVGAGTGDQCEIVECGKCRTSYLIRTIYDSAGHLKLNVSVWDVGRNVQMFARREHDDDYNFLLRFNK